MADDTFKPFEDAKSEIFKKVPDGSVLDDDKFADLKKAYEDAHGDLSKLDIYAFIKPVENTPEPNKDPSKINEESTSAPAPENEQWKEESLKKWQEWADNNNKLLSTYDNPDNIGNLSFKIYADESSKNSGNFEADFSYAGPRDVTLKGKEGQIPDQKYFDELITQLKAANGPEIEFGNIKSNEFKAKLLAACLKDPEIKITNAPSEKDIASWDKSLQDIVKVKPQNEEEKNKDNKNQEKPEEALKRVAQKRLELRERKKDKKGRTSDWQDIDANKEGLTEDQIILRKLRMGVRDGDAEAIAKMGVRREATMTDEFKYEREVEMEADGKTPKKDEKGKPIYKQAIEMDADGNTPKKDKDGKPVYKKDEKGNPVYAYKKDAKGNKIETPGYKAFKDNLKKQNNSK